MSISSCLETGLHLSCITGVILVPAPMGEANICQHYSQQRMRITESLLTLHWLSTIKSWQQRGSHLIREVILNILRICLSKDPQCPSYQRLLLLPLSKVDTCQYPSITRTLPIILPSGRMS